MATKEQYLELKSKLKTLAKEIRQIRHAYKEAQRQGTGYWKLLTELTKRQYEFRHKHIVASMLRGKSYEQIERKTRNDNQPDWDYIEKLKELYAVERRIENDIPETVCA